MMLRSGTASLMRATRRMSRPRPSTVGSTIVRMPAPASSDSLAMASATRGSSSHSSDQLAWLSGRQHEDVLVHERRPQLGGGDGSPDGLDLGHARHRTSLDGLTPLAA